MALESGEEGEGGIEVVDESVGLLSWIMAVL